MSEEAGEAKERLPGRDLTPHQEEFTGERPLVLGSILGQRVFLVGSTGLLTSVTHPQHKFQEGWQEATCTLGLHEPPVALASCTCGFYAYHRGEDLSPYHYGGERKVEALVAGRGLVTLGSKGWRAEHLRLVALVGKAAPSPLATWGRRLSQVGAEHFTFFTVIVILGFFTGGSLTSWPLLLIQGLLTFLLLVNSVLHLLLPEEYFSGVNSLPQGVLEALRNTYPHLPIYETLEEAWQAQEEGAHGHP